MRKPIVSSSVASSRGGYGLALGGLLFVGTAVRLWGLAGESAWLDEVLTLPYLNAPTLSAFWQGAAEADTGWQLAPVYYLLEYAWARCFGPALLGIRLLSVSCGVASVFLTAAIGRKLFSPRVGLTAALFLSLSLPHIFYSQEVRHYAFALCVGLFSFYALLQSLHTRPRPGWWITHLAANAVLAWSLFYTAPALLAQAVYLIWIRPVSKKKLLVWLGINVSVYLLLAGWILSRDIQAMFWIPAPGLRELVNTGIVFAGGRFSNDTPAPWLPGGLSLDLLLAVLIYGGALLAVAPGQRGGRPGGVCVAVIWAIAPPLCWFIVALIWKPCFLYRYLLFSVFPLYLLAAAGLERLPGKGVRRGLLLLIIGLFCWQQMIRLEGPFRPDYQGVSTWCMAGEQRDVPVLILKSWLNGAPMRYLKRVPEGRMRYAESEGDLYRQAVALTGQAGSCLVLMWRWDRRGSFEEGVDAQGIAWVRRAWGGLPPLYTYALAEAPEARPPSAAPAFAEHPVRISKEEFLYLGF